VSPKPVPADRPRVCVFFTWRRLNLDEEASANGKKSSNAANEVNNFFFMIRLR
jgi:hypothetical protein